MVKQVDFIMAYFSHIGYHFIEEESGWNTTTNRLHYCGNLDENVYISFNRETDDVILIRITRSGIKESTIFSGSFDEFIKIGSHKNEIRDFKIDYLIA